MLLLLDMSIGDSIITENKAKTTQGIDFINELPYDVDLFLGPKNLNGEKPNLQSCKYIFCKTFKCRLYILLFCACKFLQTKKHV